MRRTARVTFTLDPVVRVAIRGRRAPASTSVRSIGLDVFPPLAKDNGFLARFRDWEREQEIHFVYLDTTGGGRHIAYYSPADAAKIREWLQTQPDAEELEP